MILGGYDKADWYILSKAIMTLTKFSLFGILLSYSKQKEKTRKKGGI